MSISSHTFLRRCGAALLPTLVAVAAIAPTPAAAADPASGPGQVIVRFKASSTPAGRERARSGARTALRGKLRVPRAQLLQVRSGSVTSTVRTLESRSDVEYAEPNRRVHALAAAPDDPFFSDLWGLSSVRATTAWDTTRGAGQVVAVVDTGVDMAHPDLAADIWTNPGQPAGSADGDGNGKAGDVHGWDFVGSDADPTDENRHGSHVGGTIAAAAGNGIGVAGVAPGAKIMPVRVLDAQGWGYDSDVASGIVYAADEGARTINLSLGGPDVSQALSDAITLARTRGAVVVAAAGNDSADNDGANLEYPCAYPQPNLICVASIDQDRALSSFSNYGARSVDVAAPGRSILSTVPGGYSSLSGTSMATPHVSAVAALVRAAKPGTSADAIATAIRTGAVAQSNLTGRVVSGGRVDAPRAIERAGAAPPVKPATSTVPAPAAAVTPTAPPPATKPARRPACAGLHGRRLARCRLDRKVQRVCGRRHGSARRVCAKRVRAAARCRTLPRRTRSQRRRSATCMRKAQAIGRKTHGRR